MSKTNKVCLKTLRNSLFSPSSTLSFFQPKDSSLFRNMSEHSSNLVTHDFCWPILYLFQPISLHLSCSLPASSSVDWLCPQSTVDRAMVASESILQDSGSIHTHTGLSAMPQNQDMTCVFFPHTCHVNISVPSMVFDITDHTSLLVRGTLGTWRPLKSCSAVSGKDGWANSWLYGLLPPVSGYGIGGKLFLERSESSQGTIFNRIFL